MAHQGTSGNCTSVVTSVLFPPGSARHLISVSRGITTQGCVASPSLLAGLSGLPDQEPPPPEIIAALGAFPEPARLPTAGVSLQSEE